jgi:hypothetical protein
LHKKIDNKNSSSCERERNADERKKTRFLNLDIKKKKKISNTRDDVDHTTPLKNFFSKQSKRRHSEKKIGLKVIAM